MVPRYLFDIPLNDWDNKLISHCMRQPPGECDVVDKADLSQKERDEKANQLRKKETLQ